MPVTSQRIDQPGQQRQQREQHQQRDACSDHASSLTDAARKPMSISLIPMNGTTMPPSP